MPCWVLVTLEWGLLAVFVFLLYCEFGWSAVVECPVVGYILPLNCFMLFLCSSMLSLYTYIMMVSNGDYNVLWCTLDGIVLLCIC